MQDAPKKKSINQKHTFWMQWDSVTSKNNTSVHVHKIHTLDIWKEKTANIVSVIL